MTFKIDFKKLALVAMTELVIIVLLAQPGVPVTKWANDGNSYYVVEAGEIVKTELPTQEKIPFITKQQLTVGGKIETIGKRKTGIKFTVCKIFPGRDESGLCKRT